MTVLVVTGGKDYQKVGAAFRVLNWLHEENPITRVIHGGDKSGADAIADMWAVTRCVPVVRCPINWEEGRHAVRIRNHQLLTTHQPDALLVLPGGGVDSKKLVLQAMEHDIKIIEGG